jgi:phage terminase large subunit-like protein
MSLRRKFSREIKQNLRAAEVAGGSTDAFARLKKIADKGIIAFCKEALGFEPTDYQTSFLLETEQFQAQCWSRQSGKDFTASSKLFWFAVENEGSQIGVVGPSHKQAKLVIRRINNFIQNKLPKEIPWPQIVVGRKTLRTKVQLVNGAVIEAYACNPDTIRGPTLNGILATEFNFVKDDEEMYDAILFTLGTTDGFFIANSTPWSRDHVFYKIMNDRDYDDYKRFHVTWKEALEPNGPLKKNILAKLKRQFASDPWRWRREMEAEWSEDESSWLAQSLIGQCQDSMLEIRVIDKRHSFWVVK